MIIKISQTASNVKQSFDVESDNYYCKAEAGSFSSMQGISLAGKDIDVRGTAAIFNYRECFPFGNTFGKAVFSKAFLLYRGEEIYGSIVSVTKAPFKSFYAVTLYSGEVLYCYCRAKGSFNYVSIYHKDKLIALVETFLCVTDCKYNHKLYLLDEYNSFADTLSLFVVYYSSHKFSQRFHMSKGSSYAKAWTFSVYNNKYDPRWRENNFPNENYFGRILDIQSEGI